MDAKEKNFVSAVVYVHNAENQIENFLRMLITTLEDNFAHSEIICVNDCSEDHSLEKIRKSSAAAGTVSVSVVNMSYFHGLELAMNAGVDMAIGDFVYEFDHAALDFDSSMIMKIYYRSLEGFDIVSASPDTKGKLSSRFFYRVFERFTDLSYQIRTESFRILSRRGINRVGSANKMIFYRKAVYANCGLKTDNIEYAATGADSGVSDKKEKQYRAALAMDSLILFTDFGYRFSMAMTVGMMLLSVFMGIYSFLAYCVAYPVEGWTTTILFLSVAFFGLFGILTIVVKYLQLLIDLVFKRKYYSFESVEKLTR